MSGLVTFVKIMERSAIPEHLIVILSAVGDRLASVVGLVAPVVEGSEFGGAGRFGRRYKCRGASWATQQWSSVW
jgi:hypothetical protein